MADVQQQFRLRPSASQAGRLTYTVEEVAELIGISRTLAYQLIARGELPHVRLGRRILVPRRALDALLEVSHEPE